MSPRKAFKRTAASHETPPPAVCGRPHVAVLKSDQLPLVGGGSLPAQQGVFVEAIYSGDFRDAAREIAGVEPPGLH